MFLGKLLENVQVSELNLDKSEVVILGNRGHCSLRNDIEIRNLKIKHSVKIVGVRFT